MGICGYGEYVPYSSWEVYINPSKYRVYSKTKNFYTHSYDTIHQNQTNHTHNSDRRIDFLRLKVPIFH